MARAAGRRVGPGPGVDDVVEVDLLRRMGEFADAERCIRRGTHRTTQVLEKTIRQYVDLNNEDPKPFVWTASANDILAKVTRAKAAPPQRNP